MTSLPWTGSVGTVGQRRQLSLEVARSKEVDIRPIRDTQREKELLARLVRQGREQGLDAHYVISLYQAIIEDSVLNQQAYLQAEPIPKPRNSNTASPIWAPEAHIPTWPPVAIVNAVRLRCRILVVRTSMI